MFVAPLPSILSAAAVLGGATPPDAPTSLAAANAPTGVALAWVDNSDNETGFKIYRDSVLIHTTAANATSYTDTGATNGTTHTYDVKATGAGGDSTAASTTGTWSLIEDTFTRTSANLDGDSADTYDNGQVYDGIFNFYGTTSLTPLQCTGGIAYNTKYTATPENSSSKINFLSAEQVVTIDGFMASHTGDSFRVIAAGVRLSGTNNGYFAYITRNAAYLYRNDAGVLTALDSFTTAAFANNKTNKIILTASGTTITAEIYTGGVLQDTLVGTSQTNHASNTFVGWGVRCETGGGGTGLGDTYLTNARAEAA